MRKRQKGIECGVDGCTDWCVGNDLCAKHNQARHRKTEKGKAYTKKYNERYKRPELNRVCIHCKVEFVTTRVNQDLCSACSKKVGVRYAQKRYKAKNIDL